MPPKQDSDATVAQASFRIGLLQKALHAAKWNYLGVVARVLIQLTAQILLARFVGPAEFGYYTITFMAVGIVYLVAELGLSSALVQTSNLAEADVRAAWSRLLISSAVAAVALITFAGPLANLVGLPEAANYLRVAAIPLIFQLLSSIALALLRKNLDFKRIQLAQVAGMVIGQLGIGLVLAWVLHSAWAILIGWTAQLLIAWVVMYWKVQHRLTPSLAPLRSNMASFGLGAWTANIANWLIENLHMLMAGRLFGASTLGLYSVGSNLVRYPTNHLVATLQSVMFPASAAAQGDPQALKAGYLATLSLITLITVPMFVSTAILAEPLIHLLYGPAWHGAAELMQPLALAMPLHSITAVSGPILWGVGQVRRESGLQWLTVLFFLVLVFATGVLTPVQLSWIVLAVYGLRAGLIAGAVAALLGVRIPQLLALMRGPLILGLVATAVAMCVQRFAGHYSAGVTIGATVFITLAMSFALLWMRPMAIVARPLASAVALLGKRLPTTFLARLGLPGHGTIRD
jgi:O-antigen/teichoic acid export membrane protein